MSERLLSFGEVADALREVGRLGIYGTGRQVEAIAETLGLPVGQDWAGRRGVVESDAVRIGAEVDRRRKVAMGEQEENVRRAARRADAELNPDEKQAARIAPPPERVPTPLIVAAE